MPWKQLKAVSKVTENEDEILSKYYGDRLRRLYRVQNVLEVWVQETKDLGKTKT